MNFSQAVKGKLTRNSIVREIDSQSEIEFGRNLTPAERTNLFSYFHRRLFYTEFSRFEENN